MIEESKGKLNKTHKWIEHGDLFQCAKCGKVTANTLVENSICEDKICPHDFTDHGDFLRCTVCGKVV